MSLLVPRAPVQDGPSPTAQQDLHTTCITTLRSREARCSKLLGEAAFSCLVRTAKTGCGQKKSDFLWGIFTVLSLCSLPVLLPSGSTAEQGNSSWHIYTRRFFFFSCSRAPKIWFTNQNACIPPLLPPRVPENHKHPPASSPIHHTLTQSYGLRNHLPAAWLTETKPHQT